MKKHLLIVLALVIVLAVIIPFSSSSVGAQTNTALVTQLQAQLAKLQATLLTLTQGGVTVSSLNNQIATKIGRVSIVELKSLLIQRKALMLNLAKTNPRLFLTQKLSPTIIRQIPQELQNNVEQNVSLTGRLEVFHVDDFKNFKNSYFDYSLVVDHNRHKLYPTRDLVLRSGAILRVDGYKIDNAIIVNTDTSANAQVVASAPAVEALGEQKTLVLLIDFQDSGSRPFTRQEAHDVILNPDSQFQKFYRENSYNQISFSGDVKGWYRLGRNRGYDCDNSVFVFDTDIQNILRDVVNLESYDRLIFLFGLGGYCSMVGKISFTLDGVEYKLSVAWVGIYDISYAKNNLNNTLAHEMGHSLGVRHANGWDCDDQVMYGDCHHNEYGNYYDVMGTGSNSLHFNAYYKESLGWLDQNSILTISRSGQYTIKPLEYYSGPGKYSAKIIPSELNTLPLYLEYRQGYGFDSNLNRQNLSSNKAGLFVNQVVNQGAGFGYESYAPELLDASPTSEPWNSDIQQVTLNPNQTFSDLGRGLTISSIGNVVDGDITFDVSLGQVQCVRSNPGVDLFNQSTWLYPRAGDSVWFFIGVRNSDSFSCAPSNFGISLLDLPNYWSYFPYPNPNGLIAPGSSGSLGFSLDVPFGTPAGNYLIRAMVLNINTGRRAIIEYNIVVSSLESVLDILEPSGGESWPQLSNQRITWSFTGLPPTTPLHIDLRHEATGRLYIFPNAPSVSDGSANLLIPGNTGLPTGPVRLILWVDVNGQRIGTVSQSVNIVTPAPASITLTYPNNGESWPPPRYINWSSTNLPRNIPVTAFLVSATNGTKFGLYASDADYSNDGWQPTSDLNLPSGVGDYWIEVVTAYNGLEYSDRSDRTITIGSPAEIVFVSPSVGQSWQLGELRSIIWTSTNIPANHPMTLYLKAAGGNIIWLIPNIPNTLPHGFFVNGVPATAPYGYYYFEFVTYIQGVPVVGRSPLFFAGNIKNAQPPVPLPAQPTLIPPASAGSAEVCLWPCQQDATTTIFIDEPIRDNSKSDIPPSPGGTGSVIAPTPLQIIASAPPAGAIDARDSSGPSFQTVALTFSATPTNLAASDFSVNSSNTAKALSVSKVGSRDSTANLILSRALNSGERITLTHKPSGASICLGFLPGDVDQNGWALARDIGLLNSWVGTATGASQPLYKTDINRDGVFNAADVTRAGEILSAPDAIRSLPACPQPLAGQAGAQSQLANALSALQSILVELSKLMSR